MAEYLDFYNEKKFCAHCCQYVPYLASIQRSYCALCGNTVNLFSREDWSKFRRAQSKAAAPKRTSILVSKKNKSASKER
jgi:hypothetical protein